MAQPNTSLTILETQLLKHWLLNDSFKNNSNNNKREIILSEFFLKSLKLSTGLFDFRSEISANLARKLKFVSQKILNWHFLPLLSFRALLWLLFWMLCRFRLFSIFYDYLLNFWWLVCIFHAFMYSINFWSNINKLYKNSILTF